MPVQPTVSIHDVDTSRLSRKLNLPENACWTNECVITDQAGRIAQLSHCALCKVAKYKDQAAQRADWRVHKKECKLLKDYSGLEFLLQNVRQALAMQREMPGRPIGTFVTVTKQQEQAAARVPSARDNLPAEEAREQAQQSLQMYEKLEQRLIAMMTAKLEERAAQPQAAAAAAPRASQSKKFQDNSQAIMKLCQRVEIADAIDEAAGKAPLSDTEKQQRVVRLALYVQQKLNNPAEAKRLYPEFDKYDIDIEDEEKASSARAAVAAAMAGASVPPNRVSVKVVNVGGMLGLAARIDAADAAAVAAGQPPLTAAQKEERGKRFEAYTKMRFEDVAKANQLYPEFAKYDTQPAEGEKKK